MADSKRAKTSTPSPLATVQDIQKRLVRPSSSSISSPGDVQSYRKARNSTQFKLRTAVKLEDYLDSALLSQVSAKLSRAKKVPEAAPRSQKKEVRDFEWPINELKVLVDSDKEAVNLKEDLDLIEEFGNGGDGEACNPLRRFEQIATRRFRG